MKRKRCKRFVDPKTRRGRKEIDITILLSNVKEEGEENVVAHPFCVFATSL